MFCLELKRTLPYAALMAGAAHSCKSCTSSCPCCQFQCPEKIGCADCDSQSMAWSSANPPPTPNLFLTVHLILARRWMVTHFDMDLNPTVPIGQLKEELATQLGLAACQQQWFYLNVLMEDWDTLHTLGVIMDSVVEVRLKPGTLPSSSFPSTPVGASAGAPRDQRPQQV
ncbi:uncharacterized protein LOC143291322 isoform X2 [Babylonia areolata]|uniref:uncharacterized protein LOC143291322 isoform X2 n=1 Tax=Babylonia areolata TaxID=304850 RepID=UPI003FD25425